MIQNFVMNKDTLYVKYRTVVKCEEAPNVALKHWYKINVNGTQTTAAYWVKPT